MKRPNDLNFGFVDAANYQRRENKDFFNKIFLKESYFDDLKNDSKFFLIGDKGVGKTAYAVYMSNNETNDFYSQIKFVRETDYAKFLKMKKDKHLYLSDYNNIWKVIIYLLMAVIIEDKIDYSIGDIVKKPYKKLKSVIDEYYDGAFSPEILKAINFVEDSTLAAEITAKNFRLSSEDGKKTSFSDEKFQNNLLYIEKKFEESFSKIRLKKDVLLFIDGVDIRPAGIEQNDYIECIKGLANAVWSVNNDFFPTIKGGKGRMRVVLLLRPDIFNVLGLQNQNAKIRDNSILLDWRTEYKNYKSSNLFKIVDRFLRLQQDNNNLLDEGVCWDYYFRWEPGNIHEKDEANSSFIDFLRLSYHRPRDILSMMKFLNDTENTLDAGNFFTKDHFINPRFQSSYSEYLLGEVKDQFAFFYGNEHYELFLKFFEYLKGSYKFNYNEYILYYGNFIDHIKNSEVVVPGFMANANFFLQFLFDLNVICYIERSEQHRPFIHWCFRERNYANIAPKVKTNVEYEIFYGLTRALNLGRRL